MEARQGNGITLLINEKSNYGLTSFKPMSPDHPRYEFCQEKKKLYEKILEEEGQIEFKMYGENVCFSGEQAEAFIKCLFECAAEKINNYERYCSCCKDYYKNVINEGD